MPKARANIYVYSSTPFSGLIFEDEMICLPRTARYVVRNQAEDGIRDSVASRGLGDVYKRQESLLLGASMLLSVPRSSAAGTYIYEYVLQLEVVDAGTAVWSAVWISSRLLYATSNW